LPTRIYIQVFDDYGNPGTVHTKFAFSDGHVEVYDLEALALELEGESSFPALSSGTISVSDLKGR
jgi:hypothetical protein